MGTRPEHQKSIDQFFEDYVDGFYTESFLRNINAVSKAVKEFKPLWQFSSAKKHFKDEFLNVYDDILRYVEVHQ